jgi:hypothetical protein
MLKGSFRFRIEIEFMPRVSEIFKRNSGRVDLKLLRPPIHTQNTSSSSRSESRIIRYRPAGCAARHRAISSAVNGAIFEKMMYG